MIDELIQNHPTLRFLNTSTPHIRVISYCGLVYEHTPNTSRKSLSFRVQLIDVPLHLVDHVGVKAFVDKTEMPEIILECQKGEYQRDNVFLFDKIKLNKPHRPRGITPCFLRFYVKLLTPLTPGRHSQ
jgi:hypothetical protein